MIGVVTPVSRGSRPGLGAALNPDGPLAFNLKFKLAPLRLPRVQRREPLATCGAASGRHVATQWQAATKEAHIPCRQLGMSRSLHLPL